jgi:uncharacterized protein
MTTQLGIFAKHWQPGAVKTRLAASIGNEAAAALHRCFVQTLLNRFQRAADQQALWFTPADSAEEFRQLDLGRWKLEPQASGDLGERVKHYFASALLASNSPRTVLIGSDSPDLPLEYVAEAFDKLRNFPVVLGPSTDGGYYLIGASQTVPPIFDNIPWSTPEVWSQTISRLTTAEISYHVLPEWYDVDDFTGLRRLETSLPTVDALRVKISSLLTSDL